MGKKEGEIRTYTLALIWAKDITGRKIQKLIRLVTYTLRGELGGKDKDNVGKKNHTPLNMPFFAHFDCWKHINVSHTQRKKENK